MAVTASLVTIARRSLPTSSEHHNDAYRSVVWLRGDHDVATVSKLSETFARTIALDDADLVVDMSGVTFIDAATVGVIVRARLFLRAECRSLRLRSPSTCATWVLALCGLTSLLELPPAVVPATSMPVE